MRTTMGVLAVAAGLALAAPTALEAQGPPDHAQQDKKAKKGGPDRARGPQGNPNRGGPPGQAAAKGKSGQGQPGAASRRGGPPAHARGGKRGGPAPDPVTFNRNLVEKAVKARGRRAADARRVDVRRGDDGITVVREDGATLFRLDRETADDLGYWRAAVVPQATDRPRPGRQDRDRDDGGIFGSGDRYPIGDDDRDRRGPPAFCRSGEGHPVWGRDWCLDKGFGLGDGQRAWGIDRTIDDVILRRPDPRRDVLDRGGLIDVLGDVVFGRLALQSLVLGAEEPLEGRWLSDRDGPQVLRVQAGDLVVAELVDYGGDGSADRILFNLGT